MRPDIQAAVDALDAKAKLLIGVNPGGIASTLSLGGLGASRHFKKSLEHLTELIGDARVLAVAPAGATIAESAQMGKMLGLERLLVLTEDSIWEMTASGRLSGSRPQGIRTPLEEILDFRTRTERLAVHAGLRKTRYLTIDRQRAIGVEIERTEHDVLSDQAFEIFATALTRQLEAVRAEVEVIGDARESELASKIAAASVVEGHSVADEIAKLLALREQGAITDEEFRELKGKLLS
jgi:hypothetical protein